jgi:cysteine desulfurase
MIYADYNASAPLLPVVRDYLRKRLDSELFANPNTIHSMGQKISLGLEKCRSAISEVIGSHANQIFFNSGASEGVTTILHSILDGQDLNGKVVITSPIEHSVVINCLQFYRNRGLTIEMVSVSKDGIIDLPHLKELIKLNAERTILVAIMAANNETGVIQPYQEIAELCRDYEIIFFSDTTQLVGKGEYNFLQSGMDYAVCSGHKVGALPGTGFILAKDPRALSPLVFGGGQERGQRGGTQNYLGIESLAVALNDYKENAYKLSILDMARREFEFDVLSAFPEARIIGLEAPRLAGTTLIGYPGIHGQAVQIELESHDVFVSTSAACSDNEPATSKVLKAMGVEDDLGRSVIRISLSYSHGQKEYSALAHVLKSAYNKLRKIYSY